MASIEPCDHDAVWGVVYDINNSEICSMDIAEDFNAERPRNNNSYIHESVTVFRDGDLNKPLRVFTYIAIRTSDCLPNSAYRDIIVRGARDLGLPVNFVTKLEAIKVLVARGILDWVNRFDKIFIQGAWQVIRTSNAYLFRDPLSCATILENRNTSENPAGTLHPKKRFLKCRPKAVFWSSTNP